MRLIFTTILFLFILNQSVAYTNFGIQVSTGLAFPRVSDETDEYEISNGKSKIKFGVGLTLDAQLSENAYFATGVLYKTKYTSYEISNIQGSVTPSINLQYIQLPVTLKLFTNEFGDGFKAYAQFGFNFDVKVAEKYISNDNFSDAQIDNLQEKKMAKAVDLGLLMGLGIEYELSSLNQFIYAGIIYNRGLLNVKNKEALFDDGPNKEDMLLRNDIVDLVVGFKF